MPFYTYAIEITDDGETWMPEDAASVGTVGAQGSARDVARGILEGRLGEAHDVGPKDGLRVVVWHGETQDSLSMAAAVAYAPDLTTGEGTHYTDPADGLRKRRHDVYGGPHDEPPSEG